MLKFDRATYLHSNEKWKDSPEGSMVQVLFVAELEYPGYLRIH